MNSRLNFRLFIAHLRLHETPNPGVHQTGSSSNIYLSNIANTADGRIGVRVYLGEKVAEAALPQLLAHRSAVEAEIGHKLQWNPNPENDDKIISLFREADLYEREKWPEYIDRLVNEVDKFRKAFGPRVRNLNLAQEIEVGQADAQPSV
ncbi:DUF4268 domain-containing protein [Bradyrhizobium sp. 164]|uniref:DUF4268 domain-containing protein n=1 Tax=Bradyrhizobium sp. 164 TaxID=2782637 RepID=UPI001FFAA410|nr:DUF4268 domain-containing protein [Bradyrhizobium sp. 164]MCK1593352.1 DUF4268 domain-containing protein [Bradyrhizobium sp. 164]